MTLLLLWLKYVCAAPAQTVEIATSSTDEVADIKVPAGMKWLTCSFHNIHQCHEQVLSSHVGECQSVTLLWMFHVPGGQMWLHGAAEV